MVAPAVALAVALQVIVSQPDATPIEYKDQAQTACKDAQLTGKYDYSYAAGDGQGGQAPSQLASHLEFEPSSDSKLLHATETAVRPTLPSFLGGATFVQLWDMGGQCAILPTRDPNTPNWQGYNRLTVGGDKVIAAGFGGTEYVLTRPGR